MELKISRLKKTNNKMVDIYSNISLNILNVNGIYAVIKRLRLFRLTLNIRILALNTKRQKGKPRNMN